MSKETEINLFEKFEAERRMQQGLPPGFRWQHTLKVFRRDRPGARTAVDFAQPDARDPKIVGNGQWLQYTLTNRGGSGKETVVFYRIPDHVTTIEMQYRDRMVKE